MKAILCRDLRNCHWVIYCEAVSPETDAVLVFCVDEDSSESIRDGPRWQSAMNEDRTGQGFTERLQL